MKGITERREWAVDSIEPGSPTPGTSRWPVRSWATQQEVSKWGANKVSSVFTATPRAHITAWALPPVRSLDSHRSTEPYCERPMWGSYAACSILPLSLWKHWFPQNWSLMPERLGTSLTKERRDYQWEHGRPSQARPHGSDNTRCSCKFNAPSQIQFSFTSQRHNPGRVTHKRKCYWAHLGPGMWNLKCMCVFNIGLRGKRHIGEPCCAKSGSRIRGIRIPRKLIRYSESRVISHTSWIWIPGHLYAL